MPHTGQSIEDGSGYTSGLDTMSKALPQAVNYHRWVYDQFEPYLGRRLLDVGGGTGNHTELLLNSQRLVIVDAAKECLEALQKRHGKQPHVRIVHGDINDPQVQAIGIEERIDSITCFNVLEHIEDDLGALKSMQSILTPSRGRLLLFVPALHLLKGTLDDAAGHYRRYNKSELRNLFSECGFTVITMFYMNAFGALGWFINGRILKQTNLSADSVSKQIIAYDRMVVPVISRLERLIRPAIGQSLIAVGQANR